MIVLSLVEVGFAVTDVPGGKLLRFQDPNSGIAVNVQLDDAAAKTMAANLTGGIEIVKVMPGMNGHPHN